MSDHQGVHSFWPEPLAEKERGVGFRGYSWRTPPRAGVSIIRAKRERAVSYTHLDVYKRQVFEGTKVVQNPPNDRFSL